MAETAEGYRRCPFCAEEIRVEAIKCRFCGESIVTGAQLTWVSQIEWTKKSVVFVSDGSVRQLMDLINTALERAGCRVTVRSYDDGSLTFESRGMSAKSLGGDEGTIIFDRGEFGSRARVTAKTKPTGLARITYKVSATKYPERMLPHLAPFYSAQPPA